MIGRVCSGYNPLGPGRNLDWSEPTEARMGPPGIVVDPPGLDHLLRVGVAGDQVSLLQTF